MSFVTLCTVTPFLPESRISGRRGLKYKVQGARQKEKISFFIILALYPVPCALSRSLWGNPKPDSYLPELCTALGTEFRIDGFA
jgi:hypothetical protein